MADRIVYLVSKITAKMRESNLEWVDDEGLSEIMASGYEQVSAMDRKVGTTKALMVVLRPSGENRGVSRVSSPQHAEMMSVQDDFGNPTQMSLAKIVSQTHRDLALALQNLGGAGHLGSARNHSMPGLSIVSGELVGKAYDLGQAAGCRGLEANACPFPPGSAPHTKWMQGYRASACGGTQEVTDNAQQEAFNHGVATAQSLGSDDRAHCPYPRGSPLRRFWLAGFQQGGGTVV